MGPKEGMVRELDANLAHPSSISVDGVSHDMLGVEAQDLVDMLVHVDSHRGHEGPELQRVTIPPEPTPRGPTAPLRLLIGKIEPPHNGSYLGAGELFQGAGGLFGAGGPSLSCRISS